MTRYLSVDFLFDKEKVYKSMEAFIDSKQATYICAVNANSVKVANNDLHFNKVINSSGFNLCDGSMVALTYKMLYKESVSSYPGPDFFIDYLSKKTYKSFFLGSTEDLLGSLKKKLVKYDPAIIDMPFYAPPISSLDDFDYVAIADMINESDADIIWVSLGAPKQEEFMYRMRPYLIKGVMVGVGAAFTFYGNDDFKRAPSLIRKARLEWLYRTIKDPKKSLPRLKSQLYHMPKILYKEMRRKNTHDNQDLLAKELIKKNA